jgi:hypothetical protein
MVFALIDAADVLKHLRTLFEAGNPSCARGDLMDKYDVIGLAIAIIAVSIVLLH